MKDFIGNELKIGDLVAYARNPYAELNKGFVVGFTSKKIKVGQTNDNINSPILVFSYQIVKILNQNER